ncbi:methionine adenosyltransferase [Brenneria corticis]|uniref:Uncharacterized protein n=1 Tax=Brenneria corticis TaxID=2173106 RepID=A0A2U1U978_9GAMM|nr:methionine adenosyltransferase [Brenneria sp. CFCC 11842]PWC18225.1 hypothetical protein DDT56_04975 [Brenneria sp. CFCC 11842]
MISANEVLELPAQLKSLRRMISGTDNPAQLFWESATQREREDLIFHCRPKLGKSHVGYNWTDFDVNQRRVLWGGILSLRRMYEKTAAFQPGHFGRSVFVVSCSEPETEQKESQSIN